LQLIVVTIVSWSCELESELTTGHDDSRVEANWHVRARNCVINTINIKIPLDKVSNIDDKELCLRPRQDMANADRCGGERVARGEGACCVAEVLHDDQRIQTGVSVVAIGVNTGNVKEVIERSLLTQNG
jgi:hypothetical protein